MEGGDDYELELLMGMSMEKGEGSASMMGSVTSVVENADSAITQSQASSAMEELEEEQRAELGSITDMLEVIREVDEPLDFAIGCNEVYQAQLNSFADKTSVALSSLRAQMRAREAEMEVAEAMAGSRAKKRSHKVPALLYIQPYFKDSTGMAAAHNGDWESKRNEFDALTQPRKKWSRAETEKITTAVREEVLRLSNHSNHRRIEVLQDKVQEALRGLNMIAKEEYEEEMDDIRKQMRSTERNEEKLVREFQNYKQVDWMAISKCQFNGSRTPDECRRKWEMELSPTWRQSEWGKEEQGRLCQLVASYASINTADWNSIAEQLGTGRTGWAVFEEYQSRLNQLLLCGPWTEEEDERLRSVVEQLRFGEVVPWDQVAYAMEGRTRAQVQARYVRTLDPDVKRGRWTEDEDFILVVAIHNIGPKDWAKVASKVPQRTDTQCRERWMSFLTEGVEYGSWRAEEDDILREAVTLFGVGAWSRSSKLLPGRTAGMCKMRWHRMNKLRDLMTDAIAQSKARNEPPVSLEDLEASFVEPHVQGLEERKKKILERKERIKQRYEAMFGLSYESMVDRYSSLSGQLCEEDLEANINTLPLKLRPYIRAKLAKLRWRHRDSQESGSIRKPRRSHSTQLLSRALLGLPENSRDTSGLFATIPPAPLKKAKKERQASLAVEVIEQEEAVPDDPEERDQLFHQLGKAIGVIDAYKTRQAKKEAEKASFHNFKNVYCEALKAGRLLPPSHASLSSYLALKKAEPSMRGAADTLPMNQSKRKQGSNTSLPAVADSSPLAVLGPVSAGNILASRGHAHLKAAVGSITTFPRLLSGMDPPHWDMNAIDVTNANDVTGVIDVTKQADGGDETSSSNI